MATFYLLPPRALLGQKLLANLGNHDLQLPLCVELAETLAKVVEATGAYVVYRDDLPNGVEPAQSLRDGYGAEAGDEVIEVVFDAQPRHWNLDSTSLAA